MAPNCDTLNKQIDCLKKFNACFSLRMKFDKHTDAANWYQHFQAAVERTIETKETVVRKFNTLLCETFS